MPKILVAFLALVPWLGASISAADRPNIIVIVGDDMGYIDIGAQGGKQIPTPHIDSLAKNGVRCSSGYVSGPYCSPTRAGLMTGRYQQRFGHEFNPGPATDTSIEFGLPLSETTIAEVLKGEGYATGMVGKWHLGHADRFHPMSRGFEEYFGFLGGAHSYFDAADGKARKGGAPGGMLRGRMPIEEKEYLTDAFGREAVAFIDRKAKDTGKPFFLYLAFNAVHAPMQATDDRLGKFASIDDEKRRQYAAMMSAMDDAIGAVLGKLADVGMDRNTLIFFISDNGGPQLHNASDNGPLRGNKASTWEGGVRVPYLVQWPARLPAGKTYEEPVIQLDVFPTILAAAGIETRLANRLDGVNLLPHWEGTITDAPHPSLFWRFGRQMAIRMGDWKLTKAADGGGLFNLASDIGEKKDLSAEKPGKLKELTAAYEAWNKELRSPLWGQRRAQEKRKAKAGKG
jgi:arylsulfatase A-like enzyme